MFPSHDPVAVRLLINVALVPNEPEIPAAVKPLEAKAVAKEAETSEILGNVNVPLILISVVSVPSKASIMLRVWSAVIFWPVAMPVLEIVAMSINIINLS